MSRVEFEEQTKKQAKHEFSINIYSPSFNRHITIVCQLVIIVGVSFISIIFGGNISIYLSYILLSIYITWMIAHLIDSNT
ncbi:hypothetical protein AB0W27_06320 [Aliarcobacter butzleri]|uniref:hypothetical protein n=1 Tax=Aliarcobacter butzleri TaxID=28197 RepID=UPI00344F4C26